jgi:hypothetical protein
VSGLGRSSAAVFGALPSPCPLFLRWPAIAAAQSAAASGLPARAARRQGHTAGGQQDSKRKKDEVEWTEWERQSYSRFTRAPAWSGAQWYGVLSLTCGS